MIKKGDLFKIKLNNDKIKFIQYIGRDLAYMNSQVIRVFKEEYDKDSEIIISEIINGKVDFYVHTNLTPRIYKDLIIKIGNSQLIGNLEDVKFIEFLDPVFENEKGVKTARYWRIYHMNGTFSNIENPTDVQMSYNRGTIIPFQWILIKMQTGNFHYVYPTF